MRISMFTNTYRPHVGGVARSVAFFAEDLRAAGHPVLVVAPEFPKVDDAGGEDLLRVPAIQEFNGSDFSVGLPAPFLVDNRMEAFSPGVVHSHHPFLLGDTALRVAHRRNVPLVFTHHTLYERYTHYVPLDSEAMKRFVINLATEYANHATRVVAPSESIARLLRKRGVYRPVEVVPTGVDLAFFAGGRGDRFRRGHRLPASAQVVGHLGRLAPEKNLAYLSRAIAAFMVDRPAVRYLVVGDGPSRDEILQCFEDHGIADRLVLAGLLSGQALADAYQAMDLFVFASQSETQGMVLAEAMAAGKPVIALDASGAREVVRDNINGRLLPADAGEEAFTRAVADFFDQPQRAREWTGEAGRTAREFSRESCARKLLAVYHAALEDDIAAAAVHALTPYDRVVEKLKLEWELIVDKMNAAADAVRPENP
jgi:glycosyltransferase involved in cell wall biosynthesis